MAEQLPITPDMVKWARERAGLSLQEATKKFAKIEEWEAGSSSPTYSQLEQLASTFKIPIAVFFFPEPPDLPPIEETFRTLPATEFELIPSRVRLLLRKAKALQLNLHEMTQSTNPAERIITRDLEFHPDVSVEEMASAVREYIGISIGTQISWSDADAALEEWRKALWTVGIFVFKDAFRVTGYSGFCLYDDVFPVIYVNNSSAKTRQTFTLFHELAHLLFHTSGVDTAGDEYIARLEDEERRIEVLCNRFAAHFLVPDAEMAAALSDLEPSEQAAEVLATTFHVSREMIFRRFLDRGLIDQERYETAANSWAEQYQAGGVGGNYYWTKLAYLGREYVSLALNQYYKNRIDEEQLADYLDTKQKNVSNLEDYFERGAA